MLLWGTLFPMVKLGYAAFEVRTSFWPDLLLFAGIRFLICGGVLTAIAVFRHEKVSVAGGKSIPGILSVGLFGVVLHYACTYTGLSMTDSSKTALLKQSGVLLFVCFSFLFFKEEAFSIRKLISALLGLAGIIVLNRSSAGFSFGPGELLILAASVCTVLSNVCCKKYTANIPPVAVTGLSQLAGGAVLTSVALILGGRIGQVQGKGILVFFYICTASCVSYYLWYKNVQQGSISEMFIIKFLEPLFAAVSGALLLGENILRPEYGLALIFISASICITYLLPKKNPPA